MGSTHDISRWRRATGVLVLTGAIALSACDGSDDASDVAEEPASEEPAAEPGSSQEQQDGQGSSDDGLGPAF